MEGKRRKNRESIFLSTDWKCVTGAQSRQNWSRKQKGSSSLTGVTILSSFAISVIHFPLDPVGEYEGNGQLGWALGIYGHLKEKRKSEGNRSKQKLGYIKTLKKRFFLFERQHYRARGRKGREGEREKEIIHWFTPRWPHQAKASSFIWVSHMGSWYQAIGTPSVAFPHASAGTQNRSRPAGTWFDDHMGCWHFRKQDNSLHYDFGLETLFQCHIPAWWIHPFSKYFIYTSTFLRPDLGSEDAAINGEDRYEVSLHYNLGGGSRQMRTTNDKSEKY